MVMLLAPVSGTAIVVGGSGGTAIVGVGGTIGFGSGTAIVFLLVGSIANGVFCGMLLLFELGGTAVVVCIGGTAIYCCFHWWCCNCCCLHHHWDVFVV